MDSYSTLWDCLQKIEQIMNLLRNLSLSFHNSVKNTVIPVSCCTRYISDMNSPSAKSGLKRIVWVDLEMTGLDINKDHILEIACLVTDAELNIVATGPTIIIHQPDDVLDNMQSWCVNQHGESGLTTASRQSQVSVKHAEKQILKFISSHVPVKRCPLAGNSVYMDRLFLRKYMPEVDEYLHYRIIDVSTIKELAKRWYQKEFSRIPSKKFKHRSIDDIMESIAELKYYKEHIFKTNGLYS